MNETDPRDMAGALFREAEKKSDRHPDMTGYVVIGGVRYRLAAWRAESKGGRAYLSLKASPERAEAPAEPQRRTAPPAGARSISDLAASHWAAPKPAPAANNPLDDDLPF